MQKECAFDSAEETSDLYKPFFYFDETGSARTKLQEQYKEIEKVLEIIQKEKGCEDVTIYELATDPVLKQMIIDLGIIENAKILEILEEDIKKTKERISIILGDKENMLKELEERRSTNLSSIHLYQIFKVLAPSLSFQNHVEYAKSTFKKASYYMDDDSKEKFQKEIVAQNLKNFDAIPSFVPEASLKVNTQHLIWLYDTYDAILDTVDDETLQGIKKKTAKMALQVADQLISEVDLEKGSIEELTKQNFELHKIWFQYAPETAECEEIKEKAVAFGRSIIEKINKENLTDEKKLILEKEVLCYLPELHQSGCNYEDLLQIHIERANKVYDEIIESENNLIDKIRAGRNLENIIAFSARDNSGIKEKQLVLLDELCAQRLKDIEDDLQISELKFLEKEITKRFISDKGYYESYFSGKIRDLYEKEKQEKGSVAERLAL